MKKRSSKIAVTCFVLVILGGIVLLRSPYRCLLIKPKYATIIDTYNGVNVYYNGQNPGNDLRSKTADGYNLGLKYQCVEFVKRYYYKKRNHKMPESYGHAKSYIIPTLKDGALNEQRNLSQYKNGSAFAPKPDDILVFGPSVFNDYGHVAIVIQVEDRTVQIVQQNVGCKTRAKLKIELRDNGYWFDNKRVLGWLRKE
jgi:hypothetical protein